MTHGIQYLPHADLVVVMREGEISELGTYEELLDHDGAFAEFLKNYLREDVDEESSDPESK